MQGKRILFAMTVAMALVGALFGLAIAPFAENVHDAVKGVTTLAVLGGGTGFLGISLLFFRVS